jgi:hypothetical protein
MLKAKEKSIKKTLEEGVMAYVLSIFCLCNPWCLPGREVATFPASPGNFQTAAYPAFFGFMFIASKS